MQSQEETELNRRQSAENGVDWEVLSPPYIGSPGLREDVMKRIGTILIALALVTALAAIPFGAAAAVGADTTDESPTNESIAPGERMAGVIGVQGAEVNGEVSDRTFGLEIANAASDEAQADIVGERLAELTERLNAHEASLAELDEAREAGNISEGEYRSKVATIAAEKNNTERAAGHVNATAADLPEELLTERNISVEAIQELQTNASDLGGPETAAIAQSIAGDRVGSPVVDDRAIGAPDDVGPDRENGGPGNSSTSDRP